MLYGAKHWVAAVMVSALACSSAAVAHDGHHAEDNGLSHQHVQEVPSEIKLITDINDSTLDQYMPYEHAVTYSYLKDSIRSDAGISQSERDDQLAFVDLIIKRMKLMYRHAALQEVLSKIGPGDESYDSIVRLMVLENALIAQEGVLFGERFLDLDEKEIEVKVDTLIHIVGERIQAIEADDLKPYLEK